MWADDLREIGEITDGAIQKMRLNAFVAVKFQQSMDSKDAELTDALKRYALGSMQHYRTHYLLAKLTQHIDAAYQGVPVALSAYKGTRNRAYRLAHDPQSAELVIGLAPSGRTRGLSPSYKTEKGRVDVDRS